MVKLLLIAMVFFTVVSFLFIYLAPILIKWWLLRKIKNKAKYKKIKEDLKEKLLIVSTPTSKCHCGCENKKHTNKPYDEHIDLDEDACGANYNTNED